MLLKKSLATLLFLGLCGVETQIHAQIWPLGSIFLSMIAGMMAIILYEGKNLLKGPWDFVKITIIAFIVGFGYISLLLYIIIAQGEKIPDRT